MTDYSELKRFWDTEVIGIESEMTSKDTILDPDFLISSTRRITMRSHYHGRETVLILQIITIFATTV